MRVIITKDYDEMSVWAANYVAKKIIDFKPTEDHPFVLGCPTGSSPLGLYKHLVMLNKQGVLSFRNVVTFNMYEYVGLDVNHPESYHSFMWTNFFNHIDIKKENVHILDGNAKDLIAECKVNGLLVLRSGTNVIRLAPPLIITEKELDEGFEIIAKSLKNKLNK